MLHHSLPSRRRGKRRHGNVCIIVAVSSVVLLGIVALSVDGGLLFDRKSHVRATADAAALAGAAYLYENYPANQGADPNDIAKLVAFVYAGRNGYSGIDASSEVAVNIPPLTGPYAGKASYVEVIITYYQKRGFSLIFGNSTIPVKARAVARGAWVAPGAGVIVLDYSGRGALSAQGNGAFTETGAPVIVNSNNSSALVDTGNGTLKAPEFRITGNYTVTGGGQLVTSPIPNNVLTGVHPTPDPLAYLPVPTQPPSGTWTQTPLQSGNFHYILSPGAYSNLPNFNVGDIVTLKQASAGNDGIYYIINGGFNSQGATILMDTGTSGGIMIYNAGTGQSDGFKIEGNSAGSVNLTPRTSGPYQGMTYFQNRAGTQSMNIKGNGTFNIQGTLYGASALLSVEGNGAVSNVGSQYVTKDLGIAGNGNVNISWDGDRVGRTRIITLVE